MKQLDAAFNQYKEAKEAEIKKLEFHIDCLKRGIKEKGKH